MGCYLHSHTGPRLRRAPPPILHLMLSCYHAEILNILSSNLHFVSKVNEQWSTCEQKGYM